jgi:hypothetical protein
VLAELVSAGGLSWACQLPGDSLPSCALDLAAQGGHLPVLQLLREKVRIPSSTFLTGEGGGMSSSSSSSFWGLGVGSTAVLCHICTESSKLYRRAQLHPAAQGGHLPVLTLLREKVRIHSSTFLTGEDRGLCSSWAIIVCVLRLCVLSSLRCVQRKAALHAAHPQHLQLVLCWLAYIQHVASVCLHHCLFVLQLLPTVAVRRWLSGGWASGSASSTQSWASAQHTSSRCTTHSGAHRVEVCYAQLRMQLGQGRMDAALYAYVHWGVLCFSPAHIPRMHDALRCARGWVLKEGGRGGGGVCDAARRTASRMSAALCGCMWMHDALR